MAYLTSYVVQLIDKCYLIPEICPGLFGSIIAAACGVSIFLIVLQLYQLLLRFFYHTKNVQNSSKLVGTCNNRRQSRVASPDHDYELQDAHEYIHPRKTFQFFHTPEDKCDVPCISCTWKSSDKLCRFVLCKTCCQHNKATVCSLHGNAGEEKVPAIESCFQKKPTSVNLSFQRLSKCPDRMGFIGSQLHTLNLSHNSLRKVPLELGCLLGLQCLKLNNNNITCLPDIIGNFVHLKELDISNNKLFKLPDGIGRLKSLESLIITNNKISSIPSSIGLLMNLQKLHVNYNRISILPYEMRTLSNIEVLEFCFNSLTKLPDTFDSYVSLHTLDFSHNKLQSLPPSICKCPLLVSFCVQNNRLRLLPNDLGNLQLLNCLKVDNNRLHYLPVSIHSLNLYVFTVSANPLVSMPSCEKEVYTKWSTTQDFPRLLEICSRIVISNDIAYKNSQIPATLKDRLERVNFCQTCGAPLFENCSLEIIFRRICGQNVPLMQFICGDYHRTVCKFIKLEDN